MSERPMPGQTLEAAEGKLLLLEDPSGTFAPGARLEVNPSAFWSNAELTDQIYAGSTPEERQSMERCFGPLTSRRAEPRRVS